MNPCTDRSGADTKADQIPDPSFDIVRQPQVLEVVNVAQGMSSMSVVIGDTESFLIDQLILPHLVDNHAQVSKYMRLRK